MKCRSFLRMAKNVMHWNPPFSCQFEIQFCQGVDPERVQYFLHGPTAALYMRSRTKVQHRAVTEGRRWNWETLWFGWMRNRVAVVVRSAVGFLQDGQGLHFGENVGYEPKEPVQNPNDY